MWTAPEPSIRPREFRTTLGRLNDRFKGTDQQDAQEFLNFLIDGLHEEVNIAFGRGYFVFPELKDRNVWDVAAECWSINLLRNWSLFSFVFTGQLGSELTCKACGGRSWSFEPFTFLSLPISTTQLVPLTLIVLPLVGKPIQATVMASRGDTLEKIAKQIRGLPGTGLRQTAGEEVTELVMCRAGEKEIRRIFPPVARLEMVEQYSVSQELYAFEVLALRKKTAETKEEQEMEEGTVPIMSSDISDKYGMFNAREGVHGPKGSRSSGRSGQFFAHVLNRTIVSNSKYIWKKYEAALGGNPTLLLLDTELTNYALYERVWESVARYLPASSKYYPSKEPWWWLQRNGRRAKERKPFILRVVSNNGEVCARCPWRSQCLGCSIIPDFNKISLRPEETLAIDWSLDVIQDEYRLLKEITRHPSVEETKRLLQKPTDIYDVISKFTSSEELSTTGCSTCRKAGLATKRLSLLRLPMVLVVHLKRYKEKYGFVE